MKSSICFNYLVFWGQDVSKSNDYNEPLKSTFAWINKQRIFQECLALLLPPPSMQRTSKRFVASQTNEQVAVMNQKCNVNEKWGQEQASGKTLAYKNPTVYDCTFPESAEKTMFFSLLSNV